jgi:hypothetical protein
MKVQQQVASPASPALPASPAQKPVAHFDPFAASIRPFIVCVLSHVNPMA